MRVGIIKLSALGDIIVAMSFLPLLKEQGVKIDWFADSAFAEILNHSPFVDKLYSLPLKQSFKKRDFKGIFKEIRQLRDLQPYDLLIDMQGLLKSAVIGKCIPSKMFRGFGFGSCKESLASLFYQEKIHIGYEENILQRNAKILNLPSFSSPFNAFGYTSRAEEKIASLLQTANKKVLLILEASKPTKMYSLNQFLKLCLSLQNEKITFFVLHHAYTQKAQELCNRSGATLLPLLNLDEVKALVGKMDAVIGGDTGITHLAWAMNKPSITLYGNTPLKRFELKGEKNISLSGNPKANYQKDDFSINKIDPLLIQRHLLEIL